MPTKKVTTEISVIEVQRGRIEFLVRGNTPLICNAMSAKVKQQLLMPPKRKNAAEKATTLKHNPMVEFRDSMYRARRDLSTEIIMPATAFKAAMMSAALDLPGTTKTQIGRLSYVERDEVNIYGIPQVMMSVTRSADINKTPDVRTRAIIPEWAAYIAVQYTKPLLHEQAIVNLLAAAGITQGIGDWRVQKGSGNYGQFSLVGTDDKDFQSIVQNGSREAQLEAIESPLFYDSESEQLFEWWKEEARTRGFEVAA